MTDKSKPSVPATASELVARSHHSAGTLESAGQSAGQGLGECLQQRARD